MEEVSSVIGERQEAPTVFISYSHDSPEHEDRALEFANRLRSDGIDANIDQYNPSPPEGWPRWMLQQIKQSDFVICVCTPSYCQRVLGEEQPGKGLGVLWEGSAILQELYLSSGENRKFIPVLFSPTDKVTIPPLASATHFRVYNDQGYEDLYRHITRQPKVQAPVLGKRRPLPSQVRKPDFRYPSNLPIQPNPLIGRDKEVAEARTLLETGRVRLVTLTGPGGIGKSRLAYEIAAQLVPQYPDGAFVIELEDVCERELVATSIVRHLGVQETPGLGPKAALEEFLARKSLLLVIDTAEHLVDEVARLAADLLAVAPGLGMLATSREPLGIRGEHRFPVLPLALPNLQNQANYQELAKNPAVVLFTQRAMSIVPSFELTESNAALVAAICVRLDGLPLAIELAAPWIDMLSPAALLERLDHRLSMLVDGQRDLPERQRTMRATIEWSFNLLSSSEQAVFRCLLVFAGGFSLSAAEVICKPLVSSDVLGAVRALSRKSLLKSSDQLGDDPRYSIFEMIREYGRELGVATGEENHLREAHADYFVSRLEMNWEKQSRSIRGNWLDWVAMEHANFQSGLQWAIESNQPSLLTRLTAHLWRFWSVRGHLAEGRYWIDLALRCQAEPDISWRIDLLNGAATLAAGQADYASAKQFLEDAVTITTNRYMEAEIVRNLGVTLQDMGQRAAAKEKYEHSLSIFQELKDPKGIAETQLALGVLAQDEHDTELAVQLLTQARKALERLGEDADPRMMAACLSGLARAAHERRNFAKAKELYEKSLDIKRKLGDPQLIAYSIQGLGQIALDGGEIEEAIDLINKSLTLWRSLDDRRGEAYALEDVSLCWIEQKDWIRAATAAREGLALFTDLQDNRGIALCLSALAGALCKDHPTSAARLFGGADRAWDQAMLTQPPLHVARVRPMILSAVSDLGMERFKRFWEKGRMDPLDETIIFAKSIDV